MSARVSWTRDGRDGDREMRGSIVNTAMSRSGFRALVLGDDGAYHDVDATQLRRYPAPSSTCSHRFFSEVPFASAGPDPCRKCGLYFQDVGATCVGHAASGER